MVCEYEMKGRTMKVNCLGCIYGSSIEDYPACMARTIDKLMEIKNAETIVLAKNREYEYPFEQTRMLVQLASTINEIIKTKKLISPLRVERGCIEYLGDNFSKLQDIVLTDLRSDPVAAYEKIKRLIRHTKIKIESVGGKTKECQENFLENVLLPLSQMLENLELIKKAKPLLTKYKIGDRGVYREIFHPTTRPNFMLTKYMSQPPKGGEIIDRYKISKNIEVEIYKKPGSVRYIYHVLPPEFELSEDKYTILDAARRYLTEHKPKATEFAEPEKMREVFSNIGRDLISDLADQMGVKLSSDDIEEMTSILTRYTAGLGILEILLADKKIQDIYINSPIGEMPIHIFHQDYQECETNLIPTQEDAEYWVTRFRMISGRPLDEANPVLDTETIVPGGRARIAVVTRSLSPDGFGFSIRRHRDDPWTYPLYLQPDVKYFNTLFAGLMSFIVDGSRTFLIGGTRSSGKTSLLAATMLEIMKKYRIVTVEDTLELPIRRMRELGFNIERLKSRSVITQVETELPTEEAIRTALRLGDSCLILGEVRSTEARALYEAMRIGALANTVAGTIHGESAYGIFDRVVNDLGVPITSFKATDIVVICNMLKSADGLHRFRRVTEITEVRKHWKEDPLEEGGFVNLMEYSSKEDKLKPTPTLLNGESMILNEIASNVREWSGNWSAVWENINLRGKIKQAIVDYALKTGRKELMEAPFVVASNEKFHLICEELRKEVGSIPSDRAYDLWEDWMKEHLKKAKK